MGLNPFRHQDIVEHPVVVQLVPPLGRLGRIEPPSEIVRLGDLAFRGLDAFLLGKTPYPYVLPSHIAHFGYEASWSNDRLPIAHKHSERLPRFSALGHRHGGISIQNDH